MGKFHPVDTYEEMRRFLFSRLVSVSLPRISPLFVF